MPRHASDIRSGLSRDEEVVCHVMKKWFVTSVLTSIYLVNLVVFNVASIQFMTNCHHTYINIPTSGEQHPMLHSRTFNI